MHSRTLTTLALALAAAIGVITSPAPVPDADPWTDGSADDADALVVYLPRVTLIIYLTLTLHLAPR